MKELCESDQWNRRYGVLSGWLSALLWFAVVGLVVDRDVYRYINIDIAILMYVTTDIA